MKNYFIIGLVFVLLVVVGFFLFRSKETISLVEKNISKIMLDEKTISEDRYHDVVTIINKQNFNQKKTEVKGAYHSLIVTQEDEKYIFQIYESGMIIYVNEDESLYAKDINIWKKLSTYSEEEKNYQISYQEQYIEDKNASLLDLGGSNMIVLEFKKSASNVKIISISSVEGQEEQNVKIEKKYDIFKDEKLIIKCDMKKYEGGITISFENGKKYKILITLKDKIKIEEIVY